ncbi:hypothetical protein GBAR_LOCUS12195 [Geodia barretti]|uniref:Uncharacterized protein n=1 Tax=Geodia barretti TaxID=519541 RepID=A0AA35S020_GEOBA|nr:hypothetical protein GBAR_LOCUS12195 [Geodia barretti]
MNGFSVGNGTETKRNGLILETFFWTPTVLERRGWPSGCCRTIPTNHWWRNH